MQQQREMPDRIYAEVDPETNEKRWYSTKGMGLEYVRADLNPEVDALVRRMDVALNGSRAAKQASLCDLVAQVERAFEGTDK